MMIRLRSQPDGVGINVVDGDYINMIENGIIDSRITKMHAIQIAVHIVKTILKIDRNLLKDEPRE